MREAERKKDLELAEKIKFADEKLASVTKLEQDNTNLKAALGIANKEVSRPPLVFFPEFIVITHWVCRFKLRDSGGTLSAPAGCSPQG